MKRGIILLMAMLICINGIAFSAKAQHKTVPSDIISESFTTEFVVAITPESMVRAAGGNTYGQCNVDHWIDSVKVSTG